jgi:hypothetical protein
LFVLLVLVVIIVAIVLVVFVVLLSTVFADNMTLLLFNVVWLSSRQKTAELGFKIENIKISKMSKWVRVEYYGIPYN